MIRLLRQSIFLVLTALLYFPSYAIAVGPPTVLTFDDVNIGAGFVPIPTGYGGVNWPNNMGVSTNFAPPYIPQSSPNAVDFSYNFSYGTHESLVTFIGGPTVFDGAYFSGYHDVQFKLYNGASLVGTSSILSLGDFTTSGSGPTFLASGYAGPVTKVGIVGYAGYVLMDNFSFEQVPEPSTLLLLCIGAISLLGYRKAK